jgi:predicted ATPase/class 3 adenylate cyclase/tetratricopeptide (TPR) repeat protein
MQPAPTGQVTLVFTDLEGSTELWERLGPRFQHVLQRHHAILRERIAARGGFEVKTEGDAFMIAFARASDALRFALETQEALAAETWPAETGELRVRIGAHAGEPLCITDSSTGRPDYYGPAVNRAARIAAAAHGGQILASSVTWELAGDARGEAVGTDLGVHRLKGMEQPERLWQALPKMLAGRAFPQIRTLSARPTNLVPPATSFIGRERELRELAAAFEERATRLVTLTGPGGTGKTRLALRLGADLLERFEGGVWVADLSEARDSTGVAEAVARAIGAPLRPGDNTVEGVAAVLELRRPLLLILDNFEQVVGAGAATVGVWRARAPETRFLATSRALLGLAAEREYEVPALALPPPSGASRATARLEAFDGLRLFLERAREADSRFVPDPASFPAIVDLCARLDGIPLAIELAAARIRVLRPAEMLARLDQRFQILRSSRRDLPARQQTLLGAIDWTYDLLAEWERSAFRQLGVFRGGFFLEDAEAVLDLSAFADAPDALTAVQSLREKSVLRSWSTPFGARFGMYASLQDYAALKIDAAERTGARKRHAARVMSACWAAWQHHESGPFVEDLDRLDLDRGNLREVYRWGVETGDGEAACRAGICLGSVASVRGGESTLIPMLEGALALAGEKSDAWWFEARLRIANTHVVAGDWPPALAIAREVETAARAAGHIDLAARAVGLRYRLADRKPTLADSLADLDAAVRDLLAAGDLFSAVFTRVIAAGLVGDSDAARALGLFAEAETLASRSPSPFAVLPVLLMRVKCLESLGRLDEGLADLARAEPLLRALGEQLSLGGCIEARGRLLGLRGDAATADACYRDSEAIYRELGARLFLAGNLNSQASALASRLDYERAMEKIDEGERLARGLGQDYVVCRFLNLRGIIHARRGEFDAAERVLSEAGEVARRSGARVSLAQTHSFVADMRMQRGRFAEALPPIEEALRLYADLKVLRSVAMTRIARGCALLEVGRFAEAAQEEETGLRELAETQQLDSEVAIRARIYLGRALAGCGDLKRARELLEQARLEAGQVAVPAVRAALTPLLTRLEDSVKT